MTISKSWVLTKGLGYWGRLVKLTRLSFWFFQRRNSGHKNSRNKLANIRRTLAMYTNKSKRNYRIQTGQLLIHSETLVMRKTMAHENPVLPGSWPPPTARVCVFRIDTPRSLRTRSPRTPHDARTKRVRFDIIIQHDIGRKPHKNRRRRAN